VGLGDEIMAAGHAMAAHRDDPSRRVAICDTANRPRWHELWEGNPVIATPDEVYRGENVQRIQNANGCRPYVQYPFTVQGGARFTSWRARDHPGRIYLTEAEQQTGQAFRRRIGRFVVIEPALKASANPNKQWPVERYAAVVRARSDVTFVQLIHAGSTSLEGVLPLPTPSFRAACAYLAVADAYLGPEGGLHHAAAALGVRAVVIFGGYISPRTTGYVQHHNLADDGPGSPCGRWLPCGHCRQSMERITVEHVLAGLLAIGAAAPIEVPS
jgi:glycosyl transferase family 9 (putative heptosyltransferase)